MAYSQGGRLSWIGLFSAARGRRKTQATVECDGAGRDVGYGGKPVRVDTVGVPAQHSPAVSRAELEEGIREEVIRRVIGEPYLDKETRILINLAGRFVMGGPQADTGLTGRKVIVDTYGAATMPRWRCEGPG